MLEMARRDKWVKMIKKWDSYYGGAKVSLYIIK